MKKGNIGRLGAHFSVSGGLFRSVEEAVSVKATTMQIFTANQRQWRHKPLEKGAVMAFREACEKAALDLVMSHGSYLMNLASPEKEKLEKSQVALREEILRCKALGLFEGTSDFVCKTGPILEGAYWVFLPVVHLKILDHHEHQI